MKRLCVFAGSSAGRDSIYAEAAESLGREILAHGCELVYGGASVGLMTRLADTVLAGGGRVIGVMPEALVAKEVAHRGLSDLRVTNSMHERKAQMAELSDAFVALPGGLGTLDEFFEMLTWTQLGLHGKPCGLLNTAGFYDLLLQFLDHCVAERFVKNVHRDMIVTAETAGELLQDMAGARVSAEPKWLDR